MGRHSRVEAMETRQRLIDAAEWVFARQGYQAATLEQVAMAAGVTRGALYWHFRGKPALLAAVLANAQLPWDGLQPPKAGGRAGIEHLAGDLGQAMQQLLGNAHMRRVSRILLQCNDLALSRQLAAQRLESVHRRIYRYLLQALQEHRQGLSRRHCVVLARGLRSFLLGVLCEALLLSPEGQTPALDAEVSRFVRCMLG